MWIFNFSARVGLVGRLEGNKQSDIKSILSSILPESELSVLTDLIKLFYYKHCPTYQLAWTRSYLPLRGLDIKNRAPYMFPHHLVFCYIIMKVRTSVILVTPI